MTKATAKEFDTSRVFEFVVLSLVFISGVLYVGLFLDEQTTGRSLYTLCTGAITSGYRECVMQSYDAFMYMEFARNFSLVDLTSFGEGYLTGTSNLGLFIQGRLAYTLFPIAPQVGVFAMNFLVYLLYLKSCKNIASTFDVRLSHVGFLGLAIDPWILYSLIALQKEIWSVALTVVMFDLVTRRRFILFTVALVASAFFREFTIVIGLAILAMVHFRVRARTIVIALSLLLPAITYLGFTRAEEIRMATAEDLGMSSAGIMLAMAEFQSYPLGHLIAWPVIWFWNMAASAHLPFRILDEMWGPGTIGNALSAAHMLALVLYGGIRKLYRPENIPAFRSVGLVITALIAVYPISQYRYYLPALPFLVLWINAMPLPARCKAGAEGGQALPAGAPA